MLVNAMLAGEDADIISGNKEIKIINQLSKMLSGDTFTYYLIETDEETYTMLKLKYGINVWQR